MIESISNFIFSRLAAAHCRLHAPEPLLAAAQHRHSMLRARLAADPCRRCGPKPPPARDAARRSRALWAWLATAPRTVGVTRRGPAPPPPLLASTTQVTRR